MDKRALPLADVYRLLEPGPVLLLSTHYRGKPNVMTLSWHTMMEFEPPLVGCVLSPNDFSFRALKANRECVLNVPSAEMASQVVACGNNSGRDTDKFAAFALTPAAATQVKAPLVAECFANLECRVVDTRLVNRYGFFVLEVIQAWLDPAAASARTLHHRGNGVFMRSGDSIQLPSAMK